MRSHAPTPPPPPLSSDSSLTSCRLFSSFARLGLKGVQQPHLFAHLGHPRLRFPGAGAKRRDGTFLTACRPLAPLSDDTISSQPWWLALVDSWPSPLFAFYLTRHASSSNNINPGGTLTIGYTDDSLYEGSIAFNAVTSQTYWVVALDGAVVAGEAVAFSGNKGAAIDTGTTLCLGPLADVAAIYRQIPGAREVSAGSWVLPCSTTTTVGFSFGGVVYPFAASDLLRGLYQAGGSDCIGAITGLDLGNGAPMGWIIGAAWLKNVRPSSYPSSQRDMSLRG